jgi:ferrochelatase
MRGRKIFLEAGGKEFQLIPCLNEHPLWLAFLEKLIGEFMGEKEKEAAEAANSGAENSKRG